MLLALGTTIAQMNNNSDHVLSTPLMGVALAMIMALLSGAAGVYTEMIMKKRTQRSIHVQNFYLYSFGILFNVIAMFTYENGDVLEKVHPPPALRCSPRHPPETFLAIPPPPCRPPHLRSL